MHFMIKWFLIFLLLPVWGLSQTRDAAPYQYKDYTSSIIDSLPHVFLKEVIIYPSQSTWSPRQQRQYSSLEKKVRKVYPMARLAAMKVAEYNRIYSNFKTEHERKAYVKQAEKELFKDFEGEIRHMSMSEGRILIKLIDRETTQTSFEIIKEFKGGFNAFFWQAVAKIFGHNLKSEYDADNEDQMIEYIVMQIDMGYIQ
jgi:hypothetical protein